MSIAEKIKQSKQDLDDVYEAGKKEEHDAFWDAFQLNGERVNYENGFCYQGWTDVNFKPKYNIVHKGKFSCNATFRQSRITNIKQCLENQGKTMVTSEATRFTNTFQNSSTRYIPAMDLAATEDMTNTFLQAQQLKEVEFHNMQETCTFSGNFSQCGSLENIILENCTIGQKGFDVSACTLLNHDCLVDIMEALKDYSTDTSTTEWVVTIGSTNKAKLTESELNIAYDKGWQVT